MDKYITLQGILDDYSVREEDSQVEHCINQKNLSLAIYTAALGKDANGKLNRHHYRIGSEKLQNFASHLQLFEDEILAAEDFHELYKVIFKYKTFQIGPLTVYDTAHRIGAYRGIYPTEVYLHCGTKKGAMKLLGMKLAKKTMEMKDFPESWQKSGLYPHEIENILCRYKKHLHPKISV